MVDIMKGIAIIMIVNVHLVSGPFFSVGCTFHVIAFFYASGIIHGNRQRWDELSMKEFILNRASRLLYPYFTLSFCYICFRLFLNVIRRGVLFDEVIIGSIINTMTIRGIGTLWFLPVLLLAEILFFIAKKKQLREWLIIVIGIISIIVSSYLNAYDICGKVWYNNSWYGLLVNAPISLFLASIISVLFIEMGYVIYNYFPSVFKLKQKWGKRIWLVILICITSLVIDLTFLRFYRGDLHKLDIGNPFIYLICSVSGVVFVSTLSLLIEYYSTVLSSLLGYWGRSSLIIMTTHAEYFLNSITFVALSGLFSISNISVNEKLLSGLSLLVLLLVETGIVFIVNHSRLIYLYKIPQKRKQS